MTGRLQIIHSGLFPILKGFDDLKSFRQTLFLRSEAVSFISVRSFLEIFYVGGFQKLSYRLGPMGDYEFVPYFSSPPVTVFRENLTLLQRSCLAIEDKIGFK